MAELPSISMTLDFELPRMQLKGRDVTAAYDAANNAIIGGVYDGVRKASEEVKPALNEAMAQSVWSWPNTTIRKNGSDVRAPRDLIDTANLRDSMDTELTSSKSFQIVYTAPYANLVHYGGITRPYGRGGDSFVYPARPWISSMLLGKSGIEQFPLMDIVEKNVKKSWANRYQSKRFKI